MAKPTLPAILGSTRPASIAIACVLVYAVALIGLNRGSVSQEETFTSAATTTTKTVTPIRLYLDEAAFDPVRQSIEARINVASRVTARGPRYGGPIGRDIELSIDDGDAEQIVDIHRDTAPAGQSISLDVRGTVTAYPFDRYRSDLLLSARERDGRGRMRQIPVVATVWEGMPGWRTSIRASPAVQRNGGLAMTLSLQRPAPVVSFAIILYGLMIVVAVCSLSIGGLVFTARRKVESTIIGALVAMVFSVAALRNALPGAPPLGTMADLTIFLWVQIAVIAGLSLVITAWVKRGPGA